MLSGRQSIVRVGDRLRSPGFGYPVVASTRDRSHSVPTCGSTTGRDRPRAADPRGVPADRGSAFGAYEAYPRSNAGLNAVLKPITRRGRSVRCRIVVARLLDLKAR